MPKSPGLIASGFSVSSPAGLEGHGHGAALLDSPANHEGQPRRKRPRPGQSVVPQVFHALPHDDHHDGSNHQAELFYLQKQIQQQTQMCFVMEDGARVQGVIEWYDRHTIKVRGKSRVLIFKSAIKYLYKAGELGSAPGE